jgi:hypothetical protein
MPGAHFTTAKTWVYADAYICRADDRSHARQCTQPRRITIQENSRNCYDTKLKKRRNFVGKNCLFHDVNRRAVLLFHTFTWV